MDAGAYTGLALMVRSDSFNEIWICGPGRQGACRVI